MPDRRTLLHERKGVVIFHYSGQAALSRSSGFCPLRGDRGGLRHPRIYRASASADPWPDLCSLRRRNATRWRHLRRNPLIRIDPKKEEIQPRITQIYTDKAQIRSTVEVLKILSA